MIWRGRDGDYGDRGDEILSEASSARETIFSRAFRLEVGAGVSNPPPTAGIRVVSAQGRTSS